MMQDRQTFYYRLALYVIGFLLFCEWLRPLEEISETNDTRIFFLYAGFCFFLSFLQVPWWISVPLKGLGLAFILDGMYIAERIFSPEWFSVLYDQTVFNFEMMLSQEWWQMTPLFRSLLFLILLWLMSYLLYYWFVIARRMFFFVVLTLVFITVTDTFTTYEADWAIIRTFILGMAALGVSSFSREMDREEIPFKDFRRANVWILPLIGIILLSSAIGYAAPKLSPQWPDPLPYLQSATGGEGGSGTVRKVGYGEDDSSLGGSFVQDDTPMFRATVDGDRYWRIESKDTYTGKGWEDTLAEPVDTVNPSSIPFETFTNAVESEEQSALVQMTEDAPFRKLVYPYGITGLVEYPEQYNLAVHENTGEMDTIYNGSEAKMNTYVLNYDYPSFEYNQLREADGEDPEEIQDHYLQLPDNLPNRVRNLASQIVEGEDNRYDRAKAVESYFAANGFEYSTTDVAVPRDNQDYVDQFLFESQVGYCDNYSTSMVVLLRSEGIPARWVKGFTGGERLGAEENPFAENEVQNVYEVTSANAHSWVEVYFPEIGWVPFEPTQGFSNNADFYTDIEQDTETEESDAREQETTPEEGAGNPQEMEEEENSSDSAALEGTSSEQNGMWGWIILFVLVILAAVLVFLMRYRLLAFFYIRRLRQTNKEDTFEMAYAFLLKALHHKGLKRKQDQTLREYAEEVDRRYQSNEMRRLTNHYERLLYGGGDSMKRWPEVTELWENLIKRTLS
ncbi:transglutaminaseTgpA domain-containing protein [Halobacillus sp. ACCC02827]|uniref:transglutaminase TgpA family protein n=1 Tax=Halobacillus sp. ACCC02827 TaxID=3052090 RepID=UPI0025710782|nr:transglutaminaseTgpA domain-containing protein [Halobacillus sp. ACCC02827]WJE16339.1 transglutaminaseTgpA domain-containing protein [Halobacillus sp. ACCC02827]